MTIFYRGWDTCVELYLNKWCDGAGMLVNIKGSMNSVPKCSKRQESSHLSVTCVVPQDNDPNHKSRSEAEKRK